MLTQQEISDHIEISQLLQRYFRALDSKDYELLDTVFLADAVLHYELGQGAPVPYREMVKAFREFNERFCFTQHIMGQPLIELEGNTARSTVNLRALHVQVKLDGQNVTWVVYGFYRDVHVRTTEGWRIKERYFRGIHFEGALMPPDHVKRFPKSPCD